MSIKRTGRNQSYSGQRFPPGGIDRYEQKLTICVVFTTMNGTLAALGQAGEASSELGTRIRLLLPQVVPYPLALDQPRVDPLLKARRFSAMACQYPAETEIDIRLCRDAWECLRDSLPPKSIVFLGGRPGWFRRERRLARNLHGLGHHVFFVAQN